MKTRKWGSIGEERVFLLSSLEEVEMVVKEWRSSFNLTTYELLRSQLGCQLGGYGRERG